MSMLTNLAMALAHLKAHDYAHMRHMRIRLPKAQGASRNRRLSASTSLPRPHLQLLCSVARSGVETHRFDIKMAGRYAGTGMMCTNDVTLQTAHQTRARL